MEHGRVIAGNEKSRVSGRQVWGETIHKYLFVQKPHVASNLDLRGETSATNRLGYGAAKI